MKREAARRALEEERTRKEEEKKRRQQEEREREQERERKRKEKEEKAKAERREREERERKERDEKERKTKEERERKEKEDKERAEKARLEKDREKAKIDKEKQEKAEREAKERQQRASSSAVAGPSTSNGKGTSRGPRNGNGANAVASSSSPVSPRPASSATTPTKRILNKPQVISVSTSSPAIIGASLRQHPPSLTNHQPPLQQSTPSRGPPQLSSQPATPILPPPQTPNLMFAQGQGIIPSSTMSPRMPQFPPISFPFSAPGLQQQQPGGPPLPPSLGRGFNPALGAFDPPFPRVSIGGNVNMINGGVPPSPIGPPPKSKTPLASSSTMPLAPGSGRRSSVPVYSEAGPGPVARPQVAPIARPGTGVTSGSGEAGSSTSGSPRRSPSPKGVLGSSALAADDDEVVPSGNRRGASTAPIGVGLGPVGTGVVGGGNAGPSVMGVGSGQGWVSPSRPDGLGIRSPWGPPPGFGVAQGRPQTTAPQQQQQQSQQPSHPPIGPPGGIGHHPPPHHHPGMSGPIPHPTPVPPPLGGASLWASVPTPGSAPDWNTPASFFAGHPSFLNNQNTTASPPPHSAS